MVTGVERPRPGTGAATGIREGVPVGTDSREIDTASGMESVKKNKLIIVTFEGDFDKVILTIGPSSAGWEPHFLLHSLHV